MNNLDKISIWWNKQSEWVQLITSPLCGMFLLLTGPYYLLKWAIRKTY